MGGIPRRHLYTLSIVGSLVVVARHKGFCMRAGRFFGEEMVSAFILRNPGADCEARALTYVDLATLTKEDLGEVIDSGRWSVIDDCQWLMAVDYSNL